MDTASSQDAAFLNETKGPTTLAIVIVFTALSTITVTFRFISRFILFKNSGLEDYLIGFAMAFSIAMAACQIKQVQYGNGRHAVTLTLSQTIEILKFLYWSSFAYSMALTLTKFSILCQYLRIFTPTRKARIVIYIIMGSVLAIASGATLAGLFICQPVRAFWDIRLKANAKCLNEYLLWYINSALNISTDIAIAAVPIPLIAKLKMEKSQKIALTILLAVGWFVCLVSILRIYALVTIEKHQDDSSYYSSEGVYWSCIEANVAIICASVPSLRKLVVHCFPVVFKKLGSRRATIGYSINTKDGGSKGMNAFIELNGSGTEDTNELVSSRARRHDGDSVTNAEELGAQPQRQLTNISSNHLIDR